MENNVNLDKVNKTTWEVFSWFFIFIEVLKIVLSLFSLIRARLLLKGKLTNYLISQIILSLIQISISSIIILKNPT
jgi:hypothetical protein